MTFPTSIDSFAGFTSTDTLAHDNHAAQSNAEQASLVAIETKIGTGASTPANNTVLRGNGAGTTSFDQVHMATDVSGILQTQNGGTGQANLTGLPLASPSISGTVPGAATYTNPILTAPTIADFSNADHNHQSAAGGGTLATAAIQNNAITGAKIASYSTSRNNNSSNTTETTALIQTGWVAGQPGVAASETFTITFPVAFTNVPIVTASYGGDTAGVTSTLGSGGTNVKQAITEALSITTSGFSLLVLSRDASNWSVNNTVYAQWTAIGA